MTISRPPKWSIPIFSILVLGLLLYLLRAPLLRGLGQYLNYQQELTQVELMVVLAGSPLDRGAEGARLYEAGWARQIVTTGGQVPHDFAILGLDMMECDLTARYMIQQGVPIESIDRIRYGSSTLEESDTILHYCLERQISSVMIVSSEFHTRRIKRFFQAKFEQAGIDIIIRGAPSSRFDIDRWWENEYGLLAVNNEYVKLLYYLLQGY